MGRDRLGADRQLVGDLVLIMALAEQAEDLQLAGRDVHSWRWRSIASPGAALDEPPHSGDELVDLEWLDDLVFGSDEQPRDAIHRGCSVA